MTHDCASQLAYSTWPLLPHSPEPESCRSHVAKQHMERTMVSSQSRFSRPSASAVRLDCPPTATRTCVRPRKVTHTVQTVTCLSELSPV